MNILVDANIYIDAACRPENYPSSLNLLKKLCSNDSILVGLAASSYTTIYYLLCRAVGKAGAINYLDLLKNLNVKILSFTEKEVLLARTLKFADQEDACICATAVLNNCSLIATRNLTDFKHSPVKAKSPEQILRLL